MIKITMEKETIWYINPTYVRLICKSENKSMTQIEMNSGLILSCKESMEEIISAINNN